MLLVLWWSALTLKGILRSGGATSGSTCRTGFTSVKKRNLPVDIFQAVQYMQQVAESAFCAPTLSKVNDVSCVTGVSRDNRKDDRAPSATTAF